MIFRKSALVVVVTVVVVLGAAVWLIRNGIVEKLMDHELTQLAGAKSDVQGLDLSLLSLSAKFNHLEIGDKNNEWQNLVETGKTNFDVAFMPLLAKKLVVDEMTLTNLRFHTKRSESAKIEFEKPKPKEAKKPQASKAEPEKATAGEKEKKESTLDKLRGKLPQLDLHTLTRELNIDELTDPKNLDSVKAIQAAKNTSLEKAQALQDQFKNQTITSDIATLEKQINGVNTNINDLKSLKQAAEDLKAIRDNAKKIKSEVNTLKHNTQQDLSAIKLSVNNSQELINQDVQKVKSLAKLGSLDVSDIGKMVFGKAALDQFATAMQYFNSARQFISPADEEEVPKPERRKGRNIDFPVTQPTYPRLLIKTANFSGKGENTKLSGKITGLASDPRKHQHPLIVKANYTNHGADWLVNGTFDHRLNRSNDVLTIQGSNVNFGKVNLSNSQSSGLPSAFTPEQTAVSAKIRLEKSVLNSEIRFDSRSVQFSYGDEPLSGKNRQIQNSMKALFADLHELNLVATLSGPLSDPTLKISSNVDKKISAKLNQLVGAKIKETENKIRHSIQQQTTAQLNDAKRQVAAEQKKIEQQLAAVTNRANQAEAKLKAKEDAIKKKLDEQINGKKDEAKKKIEDKLKGKLKGFKF